MDQTRLNKNHENIRQEIKSVAWKQIAEMGAPALSLRSIAREMKITAPALYRYFASREELVNALIQDAYTEFAGMLETARDAFPPEEHAARLRAMCHAYRDWSFEHPQHFSLIFNTPYPEKGLQNEASSSADHAFLVLLDVIHQAALGGSVHFPLAYKNHAVALHDRFVALSERGNRYPAEVVFAALSVWSLIHGLTVLELNRQLAPTLAEHSKEFFDLEIDRFLQPIGLDSSINY